jgi:glycosyltransferase involved in cell wall biosynthesis
MKSLRILQVIDGMNIGGAEVLLVDLVRRLREAGHAVQVAYSTPGPMSARLAEMGVTLTRLPRFARVDPVLLFRLMRLMRREKPDIVHTHLFKSDLHGRLAARLASVPVVISTAHNNDSWARRAPLGWLYGCTSRLADRLIAVSEEVREYQLRYTFIPPEKIVTIDNGVDMRRFDGKEEAGRAVRAEFGIAPDAPLVGMIGRLTEQKDHATFLQAVGHIRAALPKTRFLVVGDGPLRENLIEQARSLKLDDAVIFAGLRSDIPAVMAALDVLVFSSRWEGLPVTLLEGMAAAKPVVSTAVGGVPGVVGEGESALLVPAGMASVLADAVVRVLRDPALAQKLSALARARVREKYSLDSMLDRTLALYEELWNHVANPRA